MRFTNVLNHTFTWEPQEVSAFPTSRRCANEMLGVPTLVLLTGPFGAGKTFFARGLIDAMPKASWQIGSNGNCAWLSQEQLVILGQWKGFVNQKRLLPCRDGGFCSNTFEGSGQLLKSEDVAEGIRSGCADSLHQLRANGTRLVISADGLALLGTPSGRIASSFLAQAEQAGFRVLLLEMAIDAATLHAHRVHRDGERAAAYMESMERTAGATPFIARVLESMRADRHWRLCTDPEIRQLLAVRLPQYSHIWRGTERR